MKYKVESEAVSKRLDLEQLAEFEIAATKRFEELKAKDICGANYKLFDNALGHKVIFVNGVLFEEIVPTITDTNAVELHFNCAFGAPANLKKKKEKLKKKIGKKPCNNKHEKLTYFEMKDHNGEYIAVGLRSKNPNHRKNGYNKYMLLPYAALIDLIDLPYFLEHRMRLSSGRLVIEKPGKGNVYVSRIIMARILTGEYDDSKLPKYLVVDHRDRSPLNNRAFNLRLVTPMENALNTNHIDKKIADGTFYGLGITKKANGLYHVKAYKVTGEGTYVIADEKEFEDLAEGKIWKNELETKYINGYGLEVTFEEKA